jgi:hypothetical protein
MQHVLHNHWKSWKCALGCGEIFDSAGTARDHIISHDLRDLNVTMLVDAGETQMSPNTASHCPLCGEQVASLKDYARHVGRHQKELALFALPRLDADDDAGDTTAGNVPDQEISTGSEGSSAMETGKVDEQPAQDGVEGSQELGGRSYLESPPVVLYSDLEEDTFEGNPPTDADFDFFDTLIEVR